MARVLKKIASVALLLAIVLTLFAGCAGSGAETLFTVNGAKVRRDDFMMSLYFAKLNFFSQYGDSFKLEDIAQLEPQDLALEMGNGMTLGEFFKFMAGSTMNNAIVCKEQAKKEGVSLTSEEKQKIRDDREALIKELGGAAKYNSFLSKIRSNDKALTRYLENITLSQKLITLFYDGGKYQMTDVEKLAAVQTYNENYVTARHILIFNIDRNTNLSLGEEVIAANRVKADEALAKIRGGESFDDVQAAYSEDAYTAGMTFTFDDFMPEFEEATYALQIGEVSDVVETYYGFHIIQRVALEIDEEKWSEHYSYCVYEKYIAYISPLVENADIKYKKGYENIIIQ